MTQIFKTC